ncbi:hypothetical protein ACGFYU_35725 [Streptomyces sp. NPDC048337]|uniref:hypothetical protein n=1 Tax=Streptomyces sp. NPDC048337 TaxID=3365535 RepID=UPI0037100D33
MNPAVLGLREPAAELYESLLHCPGTLPEDAARRLGLELAVLDSALAELLDRGLVTLTGDQRIVAADPGPALEPLIAERTAALAREAQRVEALRAAVPGLRQAWTRGLAAGPPAAMPPAGGGDLLGRYAYPAYREVLVVHPAAPLGRGHMVAALPLYRRFLRRGVAVRKVVAPEVGDDLGGAGYLSELVALGAEVRLGRVPAPHTVLADGSLALVCREEVTVTRARGHVLALAEEFERIWRKSEPFVSTEQFRRK